MVFDCGPLLEAILLAPVAFLFGMFCSRCCGCGGSKEATDPKDEGNWIPSGTLGYPSTDKDYGFGESTPTNVEWTFAPNPGDDSGETWYFYGSQDTSRNGGSATVDEQVDWNNLCNWYSRRSVAPTILQPDQTNSNPAVFTHRANRLPPENAVVHIYSPVATHLSGPVTVKTAWLWGYGRASRDRPLQITTTHAPLDSPGGLVAYTLPYSGGFADGSEINGGAFLARMRINVGATINGSTKLVSCRNAGTVNGPVELYLTHPYFNSDLGNYGTINGPALFVTSSNESGTVNGDCELFNSYNGYYASSGVINGSASFHESSNSGTVNGDATFSVSGSNGGTVNGKAHFSGNTRNGGNVTQGAVFKNYSRNDAGLFQFGEVLGGAEFFDFTRNYGTVRGGAVFRNKSSTGYPYGAYPVGIVYDGATFYDDATACLIYGDRRLNPCVARYAAHPTDAPDCRGNALTYCEAPTSGFGCGCG